MTMPPNDTIEYYLLAFITLAIGVAGMMWLSTACDPKPKDTTPKKLLLNCL